MVNPSAAKRILLALVLIVVGLIIAVVVTHHARPAVTPSTTNPKSQTNTQQSEEQTEDTNSSDLAQIIGEDDNPGTTYTITSTSEPTSGWMVVKLVATNEYGNFDQIAILQRQADGSLKDVAGPDTSFLISYLNSINAPPQVISAVPTQNE